MDLRLASLILGSVILSAVAQITLKFGMSSERVKAGLADESHWIAFTSVATTPAVLGGLTLYVLGAALWLLVLAEVDVTQAYPFVGLGFLVTMALGILLLGESVTLVRVAGTLLVASGVFLVARS